MQDQQKATSCELCGKAGRPDRIEDGYYKLGVRICRDRCTTHKVIRGALCIRCNTCEDVDFRMRRAGKRSRKVTESYDEWRARCPQCLPGAVDTLPTPELLIPAQSAPIDLDQLISQTV